MVGSLYDAIKAIAAHNDRQDAGIVDRLLSRQKGEQIIQTTEDDKDDR